jgi:undecaprenyl-diphosphatase
LSVVFLYWRTYVALVPTGSRSLINKSNLEGWPGVCRIGAATVPALVVGYAARHVIKEKLFTPEAVTLALALGGLAILLAERLVTGRRAKALETITLPQAFGVGLFQVLALWPGTSRAAATIVGGMLLGLDRKSAAEFSFLIAVPIMFAATGYEMVKMREFFALRDAIQFGIGFVVSFIVALLAVRGFLRHLERGRLTPFAWYRILAAPVFYLLTRGLSL